MTVQLWSFLPVSALLIVAPGPDMALVARNALVGGVRSGVLTSLGSASGLVIWSLRGERGSRGAAACVGACVPGAEGRRRDLPRLPRGRRRCAPPGGRTRRRAARTGRQAAARYRQGLVSNLGNPKIAVFFTSFLPQFAPAGASFFTLLALGLVFCLMTLVWLVGVQRRRRAGAATSCAGRAFGAPLEGVTGVVLIGFGVRLATEHR